MTHLEQLPRYEDAETIVDGASARYTEAPTVLMDRGVRCVDLPTILDVPGRRLADLPTLPRVRHFRPAPAPPRLPPVDEAVSRMEALFDRVVCWLRGVLFR